MTSRIHEIIAALGMRPIDLAPALGFSPQRTTKLLNGQRLTEPLIHSLAKALDVTTETVIGPVGAPIQRSSAVPVPPIARSTTAALVQNQRRTSTGDLPVRYCAEFGPDIEVDLTSEPIDWIPRPTALIGARRAYAIYCPSDAFYPLWRAGDIIYIYPDRPPARGDFALVMMRGNGQLARCMLRELVERTPTTLMLRRVGEAKLSATNLSEVQNVSRVTPWRELVAA